ncbi:MAG: tripartite tricarboxylate transporter TctB family protein [Alkalilacustris sp.]
MPVEPEALRLQRRLRTAFVLALAALAVFVIWTAADFRRAARLLPVYAGWITLGLCGLELARQLLRRTLTGPQTPETADIGVDASEAGLDGLKRGLGIYGWMLGFGGLIVALGMPLATVIFVPLLLHVRFRSDWRATVGIVLGLLALMWALRTGLMLRLPPGLSF